MRYGQLNHPDFKVLDYLLKQEQIDNNIREYVKGCYSPFGDYFKVLSMPYGHRKGVMIFNFLSVLVYFISLISDLKWLLSDFILISETGFSDYSRNPFFYKCLVPFSKKYEVDFVLSATQSEQQKICFKYKIPTIPLGNGSWADPNTFYPMKEKKYYDFILIIDNLHPFGFKNEDLLIDTLAEMKHKNYSLLILRNRRPNQNDLILRNLIITKKLERNVTMLNEMLPPRLVNIHYNQSRCYLLTSSREGDNRGLSEALMANIPCLVLKNSKSIQKTRINKCTGLWFNWDNLERKYSLLQQKNETLKPREWAQKNISGDVSTLRLKKYLRQLFGNKINLDIQVHYNRPLKTFKDDKCFIQINFPIIYTKQELLHYLKLRFPEAI